MDSIKIVQHNVGNWKTNKNNLIQNYRQLNPDITLINSQGLIDGEPLSIQSYTTHKINTTEELSDDSAIAVKQNIYKLIENFITDLLAIQVDTDT